MASLSPSRRASTPALVVAGLLLVLAALILRDAFSQTLTATYGIGPTAMPYVVGGGLILLAVAHLALAFKEGLPQPEDEVDPTAVAWLAGGLLGLIACIGLGIGFIPATTIVFAATARAFGRRALLVDVAIGFGLGVAIYLLFSKLLTLSLPQGPLENLIT